ncbi:MAG: hypothetical protein VKP63_07685 [Cyanobacteriota bacterium]|nr:hypothetical protein [Cyanobacteriota bacterium]
MKTFGMLAISAACSVTFSSANAQTLVEFDFENFSLGQVAGGASSVASGLAASFDMNNNGIESLFPPSKSAMTRFAGSVNYPRLDFSASTPISLDRIEFDHYHNHNPGFPTHPSYNVNLQLDRGSGFATIGTFNAYAASGFVSESFAGPGALSPGSYSLRWLADVSPDTNTEFFSLDNIRLVQNPVPGPLPLMGAGMGYAFSRKLRRRIRSV